jgi:hypothetical protein
MQFTKANIKPGLKYKHYTYPGKWYTDTIVSVEGNKLHTKNFYEPHLVDEFVEKINNGFGSPNQLGRSNCFKLVTK